jgi:hypothetical protein
MRRVLSFVLALLVTCGASFAQQPLALRRIVIYKNGMAYLVRSGEIQSPLTMTFHPKDMNDVLKTFVAWNPNTAELYSVGYTTDLPSRQLLARFPFVLEDPNIGLAGFLRQVKGAGLLIDVAGRSLNGTLVGINSEERSVQQAPPVKDERLTLLLSDGAIRNVWLSDLQSVQFEKPALTAELRAYLAVLNEGTQDVAREVRVYPGRGTTPINIGYVQQFPVWKTSYRVDMEGRDGKLQAWTQIDNPTGENWDNVELTLVSGMPISFDMNLYAPLYTSRKSVSVPGASGASPRTYEAAVETTGSGPGNAVEGVVHDPTGAATPGVHIAVRSLQNGKTFTTTTDIRGHYEIDSIPVGLVELTADLPGFVRFTGTGKISAVGPLNINPTLSLGSSAESVTVTAGSPQIETESAMLATFQESESSQVQDYFEYKFPFAIHLDTRQSALLPFLNRSIKLERLSIYNSQTKSRHPQLGAMIENNTDVPFESGPVTLFQDGQYAGEAVLGYVSRGEKRLISYGVDYDIEISARNHELPEKVVKVKAAKGTLMLEKETVNTVDYELRNKSTSARVVVIEHPREDDVKISGAVPFETTDNFYRFRFELKPKQEFKLALKEVESSETQISIRDLDRHRFEAELLGGDIPPALRAKLNEIVREREVLTDLRKLRAPLDGRITTIFEDQTRLRENLKALRDTGEDRELRKKYLDQLAVQETQLAELRGQINDALRRLQDQESHVEKLVADLTWD